MVQPARRRRSQIPADLTSPHSSWDTQVGEMPPSFGIVHILLCCCHFLCPVPSCRGRSCCPCSPDGTGKWAVRAELVSCQVLTACPCCQPHLPGCLWDGGTKKIFNSQATYVQIKLDTPNDASGLDAI